MASFDGNCGRCGGMLKYKIDETYVDENGFRAVKESKLCDPCADVVKAEKARKSAQ